MLSKGGGFGLLRHCEGKGCGLMAIDEASRLSTRLRNSRTSPKMKNIEFAFARHASASSEMEQKIYDLLITFVRHSSAIAKPESSLNYLTAWSQLLANSAKSQPTHLVAPLWFMDVLKTFANANSSRHFFAFLSLVLGETRLTLTCAICAKRKIFRIFPFSGLREKQSCLSRWICFWNWFGLRNRFACGGRQM